MSETERNAEQSLRAKEDALLDEYAAVITALTFADEQMSPAAHVMLAEAMQAAEGIYIRRALQDGSDVLRGDA